MKAFGLWGFVTEGEKKYLKAFKISETTKIHYQWLCECCQALAWSLGLVDMDPFTRCKETLSDKIPPNTNPHNRLSEAKLRPLIEIQKQVDLHYRLHWTARQTDDKTINYNVIVERRRALDWAYGVADNWDEVSLDT